MATEGSIRNPPEIITEILSRLPSKSLGRFRCVSKDWLSLISSPHFIKTHQKTLKRNHLIYISDDLFLYTLSFHQHQPMKLRVKLPHFVRFLFHGSCNGLVLLTAFSSNANGGRKLVILNPTTKKLVELPKPVYHSLQYSLGIKILYGFGYDSLTDDYKVVIFALLPYTSDEPSVFMSVYVSVYRLRTNTWSCLDDSPFNHFNERSLTGVFVNGFLHWIAKKGSDDLPVIIAFSLADEKLSQVPSPNLSNDVDILSKYDCKLVVLGEKLGIYLEVEGVVWLMNEYGVRESWTKISIYGLSEISTIEPMILDDNGKILLVSRNLAMRCDIRKSDFCMDFCISPALKDFYVGGAYVESLVSPKFR